MQIVFEDLGRRTLEQQAAGQGVSPNDVDLNAATFEWQVICVDAGMVAGRPFWANTVPVRGSGHAPAGYTVALGAHVARALGLKGGLPEIYPTRTAAIAAARDFLTHALPPRA